MTLDGGEKSAKRKKTYRLAKEQARKMYVVLKETNDLELSCKSSWDQKLGLCCLY
jgi:hypothetical protein